LFIGSAKIGSERYPPKKSLLYFKLIELQGR
jgi:hypothetical protein